MNYYVYLHRRVPDGRVFYVGKGCNKRAWSKTGRSEFWKRVVSKYGYTVEIVQSDMQQWWAYELERELVAYYGRELLCNLTDGGDGPLGWKPSPETKARMSSARIGIEFSVEHRKNIGLASKGRAVKDSTREVLSKLAKGRVVEPSVREKLSSALKGRVFSDEHRKKIGDGNRGKVVTAEGRKNMSEAHKGYVSPRRMPIVCSNGKVFASICEADAWLRSERDPTKSYKGSVALCCAGKRRVAYGFSWRYLHLETTSTAANELESQANAPQFPQLVGASTQQQEVRNDSSRTT